MPVHLHCAGCTKQTNIYQGSRPLTPYPRFRSASWCLAEPPAPSNSTATGDTPPTPTAELQQGPAAPALAAVTSTSGRDERTQHRQQNAITLNSGINWSGTRHSDNRSAADDLGRLSWHTGHCIEQRQTMEPWLPTCPTTYLQPRQVLGTASHPLDILSTDSLQVIRCRRQTVLSWHVTPHQAAAAAECQHGGAGVTKLNVDDAIEHKVDGKVNEQKKVCDDDRRLVCVVAGGALLSGQDVLAEQGQNFRGTDE